MIIDRHARSFGKYVDAPNFLDWPDAGSTDAMGLSTTDPGSSRPCRMPDLSGRFPVPVWMCSVNRLMRVAVVPRRMPSKLDAGDKENEHAQNG